MDTGTYRAVINSSNHRKMVSISVYLMRSFFLSDFHFPIRGMVGNIFGHVDGLELDLHLHFALLKGTKLVYLIKYCLDFMFN